ncbi:MAG: cysteine hydrolase [Planctomycetaceae bacterium]|nr:cysteine hydrolase [Planctomycetaceae bacterium]
MSQALLLIDIQQDYFPGGQMELEAMQQASDKAAELLAWFRNQKLPVIHVRHVFPTAEAPFFKPDTPGIEIHPTVEPISGEIVITKQNVNSFQGTDLKLRLDSLNIDELVICGAMSQMCIEGTTRAAAELNYKCQVIHDACATCNQEFQGRTILAQDVHGTAMATLGFAYAQVLSTDEWKKSN